MNIILARRIAQTFFFALFLWFCLVSTLGGLIWQLRGWPVNWFLQLDPLVGLGLLLATQSLYWGLLWGVLTIVLTLFLGRFFCGWVCPMGSLQHFVGYLGQRGRSLSQRIQRSQPSRAQRIKYWVLLFLLSAAGADLLRFFTGGFSDHAALFLLSAGLVVASFWILMPRYQVQATAIFVSIIVLGALLHRWNPHMHWLAASLQIGLLDPIAFIYRSVNLVVLPVLDAPLQATSAITRYYQGSAIIGALFLLVLVFCIRLPRFYCRYVCPLGALFGLLSRWSVWRMGKSEGRCRECRRCDAHCEGACAPSGVIRTAECVLCLNCMDRCRHGRMTYAAAPSAAGEYPGPDLARRRVITSIALGIAAAPMVRVSGGLAANWNPDVIRPPGALSEVQFLSRCIKCGQCMRICPTNVIQPAAWQAGLEGLWSPVLDFRIGTSGCQHNCVACSHVCPTAALRPLTVDERMGRDQYAASGPLRMGMAFVDRSRCLPWAMDTPCIVCQENCPVSPKAIFTRTEYRTVRNGVQTVQSRDGLRLVLSGGDWPLDALSGGDYVIRTSDRLKLSIAGNSGDQIDLADSPKQGGLPRPRDRIRIDVRLQKPYVDPHRCIGCGVCEHVCPVQGRRAIRITAENESRHARNRMVIR